MSLPVIVLGCGGHSKVLIEALKKRGEKILGIADSKPSKDLKGLNGISLIGNDDAVLEFLPESVLLVNGLGSVADTGLRMSIYQNYKTRGYQFATVIHPSSIIASDVEIGEGSQIMAGAIIQTGTKIGDNVIINTRASVDHDCIIGSHAHVAPGVTLSGGVEVGEGAHIGTGATVIQGVRIGRNTIIGAGSIVIKNMPEGVTAMGVPAKVVRA